MKVLHSLSLTLAAFCILFQCHSLHAEGMDEMWGEQVAQLRAADGERGQLFEQGNSTRPRQPINAGASTLLSRRPC